MLTSLRLQNLNTDDFCALFMKSVVQRETEKIIEKVLYEQFVNKKQILVYDLNDVSILYRLPLIENLKKRFQVSSIYFDHDRIYIDWSLPAFT